MSIEVCRTRTRPISIRGTPQFCSRSDLDRRESMEAGSMNDAAKAALSKVPAVTLGFWIIKIAATTLGETGGDALSMSMNLGYAVSSLILIAIFLVAVVCQISARSFHPFLYWAVIVATTTAGTTMADF